MDRNTIILTLDERQEKLGTLLSGKKQICSWAAFEERRGLGEKIYVLPIPVTKLDQKEEIKQKLKQELINDSKDSRVRVYVFGGLFDNEWKTFLMQYHIPYWDFMKLDEVVEGNAWITAEATVAEVLARSSKSIRDQQIMVTGFGCCGEKIAKVFSLLGAKILVVARREEVRAYASAQGYEAIDFPEIAERIGSIDTVVNTVPAMVIDETIMENMRMESLIIDIASKPGGTDFAAAKRRGIPAKLALGLPGIYTTTSSAELLKQAILKYAPLKNDIREDTQWIFQIII